MACLFSMLFRIWMGYVATSKEANTNETYHRTMVGPGRVLTRTELRFHNACRPQCTQSPPTQQCIPESQASVIPMVWFLQSCSHHGQLSKSSYPHVIASKTPSSPASPSSHPSNSSFSTKTLRHHCCSSSPRHRRCRCRVLAQSPRSHS